jgi:single-strand DNA-binding protein
LNQCMFIGNLTADPELRYAQNGTPVTQFSIAVNERTKDGKETTEFLDFVCWDKLAGTVAEYARKGRKVAVIAAYHLKRWETDDGQKRSKPEFRARNVEFLDKPREDQPQQQRQQPQAQAPRGQYQPVDDSELDDLPF